MTHNPALCYLVALKPPLKGVGGDKLSDNQAAFCLFVAVRKLTRNTCNRMYYTTERQEAERLR